MLRLTAGGGDGGPDFDLSDEILSVIPTDPFEQLDLARKITSMAIASRVSNLEAEVVGLRHKLLEKERAMHELEEKASRLERDCREADSRLKIVLDDNMKLTKERDTLTITVKKLSHDFSKLEAFKRQLIKSLSDDNASQAEPVDIGTCDQSVPASYADKDAYARTNGHSVYSYGGSKETVNSIDEASRYTAQRLSMTPYISPRLTPTGTPKIVSTTGSPRGYSAAGSPKKTFGAVSPTKPHYESKQTALWYPSSQQSSAANSPPRGHPIPARPPRMDGKEFFRQARSRLSYEQFSAFLANIKELNAQKQTREETLRKAEEIFGMDNQDLYLSFQGLLNRNLR